MINATVTIQSNHIDFPAIFQEHQDLHEEGKMVDGLENACNFAN